MPNILPNKKPHRILVTGAGGPAGVNAVRLLSNFSDRIEVFATDIDPTAAGQFFAKEFALSAPCKDVAAYQKSLFDLIKRWNIDVVLPTVAEELIVIREALKDYEGVCVVSSQDVVDVCHDKRQLYKLIHERAPDMMVAWTTADQAVWKADRYFVKPAIGRGAKGCRLIEAEELSSLQSRSDASDWIVMEVMPGKEWTVDAYIDQTGKAAFIVPRERLQLSGGISSKGRTDRHEKIIALTERILSLLPCWGPVCVQWKLDKNGEPKLLEVNPRLSGGATITALAGANPMACLLEDLTRGKVEPVAWKQVTVVRYFEDRLL